jgi:hypothetical protein
MAEGAAFKTNTNTSNPNVFLGGLNQTHFEKSAELFVEAP